MSLPPAPGSPASRPPASRPLPRIATAIFVSGRGSNMRALLEAAAAPDFPATIALVVSDMPQAPALDVARAAGVPAVALDRKAYPSREAFEAAIEAQLVEAGIGLVCLAGFMRLLGTAFVEHWSGRMLNIHPSLLPALRGLHTHERALAAGLRIHGCTVHFVVPEVDAGPILAQVAVPVLGDDTAESLAARVLRQEHRLYPRALHLVASGALRLEGGRVVGAIEAAADAALEVPNRP